MKLTVYGSVGVESDAMHDGDEPQDDGTVDILYLVDRLEELVGIGKRVPFSGRVMVEEEEFLALVDQLRVAVPNEIKQARRIIKERERIVGEAQAEAAKILEAARQRSEYFVSDQGILNEAKQRGEEILRQTEEQIKRSMGEIDVYALKQFGQVEEALRQTQQVVEHAMAVIDDAKGHVGH